MWPLATSGVCVTGVVVGIVQAVCRPATLALLMAVWLLPCRLLRSLSGVVTTGTTPAAGVWPVVVPGLVPPAAPAAAAGGVIVDPVPATWSMKPLLLRVPGC